jgi:hypothetical protein
MAEAPAAPDPNVSAVMTSAAGNPAWPAAALFAGALLVCLLAYLAVTVPSNWFPGAAQKSWGARDLTLARGSGAIIGDELVITAPDASGVALLSLNSDLRASDYAAIAWIGIDVPDGVEVRLLWKSDYQPNKLNTAPVTVESRQLLPVVVAKNPAWIGRVTGIALAFRGTFVQPIRIRGVVAKPMGAFEVLGDRAREWFAFEAWTGASINTVTGGADVQDLPLPMLLAFALGLAGAVLLAIPRWRPNIGPMTTAGTLIGLFVAAWLVLDARWTWNLVRQVRATASEYAGKDVRQKHLAAEDGPLFAFIEKARAIMPATPARVFVVANAHYFRGRAAYHLYPHNVYTDRIGGTVPPASVMRPGDWLLVYQSRGIQYDAGQGKLRWDDTQTIPAEVKLTEPGAALFLIR